MAGWNGCLRCVEQLASMADNITMSENSVAGNQYLRAGSNNITDRVESNAAVDLNSKIQPSFLAHAG